MLSRRHDVIALRASDPRERSLPAVGIIELEDPETGRRVLFDTGSRALRRKLETDARRRQDASDRVLRRAGVDVVDLSTARPFGVELERYFRLRERRRRHG